MYVCVFIYVCVCVYVCVCLCVRACVLTETEKLKRYTQVLNATLLKQKCNTFPQILCIQVTEIAEFSALRIKFCSPICSQKTGQSRGQMTITKT